MRNNKFSWENCFHGMLTVFIRYLAKRFTYVLLLEWPNQWEFSKFKFNLCCSFFMSSSHSMVLLVKYCLGYQCITVNVWALKCTILVHFFHISLWQFIFFHVTLFSYCTFFILRHFHAPLFCVTIFLCCTFFRVALFICIALFHVALLHIATFSFCILLLFYFHILFCIL